MDRSEEHTSELQSRPHLVPHLFPYTTLFRSRSTGVRADSCCAFRLRPGGRTPSKDARCQPRLERLYMLRRQRLHGCCDGSTSRRRMDRHVRTTKNAWIDRKSTRLNSSHVRISYHTSFPTRRSSDLDQQGFEQIHVAHFDCALEGELRARMHDASHDWSGFTCFGDKGFMVAVTARLRAGGWIDMFGRRRMHGYSSFQEMEAKGMKALDLA